MTSKAYSTRSNCVRAAQAALGKTAKPGVEFTIRTEGKKDWRWAPKAASAPQAAEPKAADDEGKPKKAGTRKPRKLSEQPKMVEILDFMRSPEGMTVEGGAKKLGIKTDSLRGAVSRLRQEVSGITVTRQFRRVTYKLAAALVAAMLWSGSDARAAPPIVCLPTLFGGFCYESQVAPDAKIITIPGEDGYRDPDTTNADRRAWTLRCRPRIENRGLEVDRYVYAQPGCAVGPRPGEALGSAQ